jgi:hypothetical protein
VSVRSGAAAANKEITVEPYSIEFQSYVSIIIIIIIIITLSLDFVFSSAV